MMTTNLFVIGNVKQLRTGGSFRVLLPSFRTSWGVGVLNSAVFNSFHNRVEFGAILEGLQNFGEGWNPLTPLDTPLVVTTAFCVVMLCNFAILEPNFQRNFLHDASGSRTRAICVDDGGKNCSKLRKFLSQNAASVMCVAGHVYGETENEL